MIFLGNITPLSVCREYTFKISTIIYFTLQNVTSLSNPHILLLYPNISKERMNNMSCNTNSAYTKELVDVTGLCTPGDVTEVLNLYPYWKQMYIPETLSIPPQKPDIEVVNSLDISVNIIRADVIRTPRSYTSTDVPIESLEGKLLTGRKLIIQGELCQKVVYTANETEQPVHSAHFYVPFSAYIVIPEEVTFTNGTVTTTIDSCSINYEVNACIEDASILTLDERTVYKQITLLLYAVPTQS